MTRNLFDGLPASAPAQEEVVPLLGVPSGRVERIVSFGQSTDWYEQDEDEWVAVLAGEGVLEFADGSRRTLRTGDYITIPRHLRHRVAATAADEPTVWLAVFLR
jgi:cupin 2 domain-containing protein